MAKSDRPVGSVRVLWRQMAAVGLAGLLLLVCGCEEDPFLASTAGHDFGDTDPSRVSVIGDSIAIGYGNAGAAWPTRLAQMLGRPVANFGVGGLTSDGGLALINTVLADHAGFVLIDLGANDAIHGYSADHVRASLQAIAARVRDAGAIPLIADLTPMSDGHAAFSGAVDVLNATIHDLCRDEAIPLVGVADAFGDGSGLLQGDGLHPNSDGQQLIAEMFNLQLRHAVQ